MYIAGAKCELSREQIKELVRNHNDSNKDTQFTTCYPLTAEDVNSLKEYLYKESKLIPARLATWTVIVLQGSFFSSPELYLRIQ